MSISSDLKIENVYRSVEVDGPFNIESSISDLRVQQEMENNGMRTSGLEISQAENHEQTATSVGEGSESKTGFLQMLRDSLENVNTQQLQADQAIENLVSGRTKNIHETLLAVERADASLKLMMQVRNKILESYREIMRMQV